MDTYELVHFILEKNGYETFLADERTRRRDRGAETKAGPDHHGYVHA
ncbi:MAG: hypothetical protein M0C28_36130 [Candidatus Moduliflexus flocculans]|nr:hypothetical protein [Candidatus Moduliflexus flocculans]